jgi:hypothetical protein
MHAHEKLCKKCGVVKPIDAFYRATGTRDGRRGECIECSQVLRRAHYEENRERYIQRAKDWQLANPERTRETRRLRNAHPERKRKQRDAYYRRTFGISADEVDAMIAAQGGVCAICQRTPEREASWHVDHDHDTGAVRGVLCIDCNHGLGKLGDSIERLEFAIAYSRRTA